MDKKPLTEPKTETECAYKDSHERASKRKANSLIANLTKDSSTEDEEDKWYDCSRNRRKKIRPDSKSSNVERGENHHVHNDNREKAMSGEIARQENSINDNNSDTDLDNEHAKSVRSKKTEEKNESVSTELNTYPRRIVPPNPKARPSLLRQRKGTATSKSKTRCGNKVVEQAKKQKNTLTDSEIQHLVEDWNSDEEKIVVKRNEEMQPLPISKEVRSRLHEKRLSLRRTKTVKKTKPSKEEESDEEKKREKRPKLCEREEEESCRVKNGKSWEHQLMSDDEDNLIETSQVS